MFGGGESAKNVITASTQSRSTWICTRKVETMANGLCDRYCDGCVFCQRSAGGGGYRICTFYLSTNTRRPCPAGDGCIVKQKGKKLSKWCYENNVAWDKAIEERNKVRMQYARQCQMEKRALNPIIKVCPECGVTFNAKVPQQIYCSKRCKCRVESRKRYWGSKNANNKD